MLFSRQSVSIVGNTANVVITSLNSISDRLNAFSGSILVTSFMQLHLRIRALISYQFNLLQGKARMCYSSFWVDITNSSFRKTPLIPVQVIQIVLAT